MRNFVSGVIVGLILSGSVGLAQNIYDRKGQPAAPRGSIQQQDYFRQRGQQLDVEAMRRESDRQRAERTLVKPCDK